MHIALRRVDRAIEVEFQEVQHGNARDELEEGPAIGHGGDALLPHLAKDMEGHSWGRGWRNVYGALVARHGTGRPELLGW